MKPIEQILEEMKAHLDEIYLMTMNFNRSELAKIDVNNILYRCGFVRGLLSKLKDELKNETN